MFFLTLALVLAMLVGLGIMMWPEDSLEGHEPAPARDNAGRLEVSRG